MKPLEHSARIKIAVFPPGVKDADQLLNSPGGDAAWEKMIREAKDAKVWLIDDMATKMDFQNNPHDRHDMVQWFVDIMADEDDDKLGFYLHHLSDVMGIHEEVLAASCNDILEAEGRLRPDDADTQREIVVKKRRTNKEKRAARNTRSPGDGFQV
jgi:hypothetical protein